VIITISQNVMIRNTLHRLVNYTAVRYKWGRINRPTNLTSYFFLLSEHIFYFGCEFITYLFT